MVTTASIKSTQLILDMALPICFREPITPEELAARNIMTAVAASESPLLPASKMRRVDDDGRLAPSFTSTESSSEQSSAGTLKARLS